MEFDDPSSPEYFKVKDHVGSLALLAVNSFASGYTTSFGIRDVVKVDVVLIDGPTAGQRFPDAMIFSTKMVPQLKASLGRVVLGRIAMGQARPGQNAPYVLDKPTQGDVSTANAWVEANGPIEAHVVEMEPAPAPQPQYPPFTPGVPNGQYAGVPGQGFYGPPPQQDQGQWRVSGQPVQTPAQATYTAPPQQQPQTAGAGAAQYGTPPGRTYTTVAPAADEPPF